MGDPLRHLRARSAAWPSWRPTRTSVDACGSSARRSWRSGCSTRWRSSSPAPAPSRRWPTASSGTRSARWAPCRRWCSPSTPTTSCGRSPGTGGAGTARTSSRRSRSASDLPGAVAAREGTHKHYRSRAEILAAFPDLAGYYPTERSLHLLSLHRDGSDVRPAGAHLPPGHVLGRRGRFPALARGSTDQCGGAGGGAAGPGRRHPAHGAAGRGVHDPVAQPGPGDHRRGGRPAPGAPLRRLVLAAAAARRPARDAGRAAPRPRDHRVGALRHERLPDPDGRSHRGAERRPHGAQRDLPVHPRRAGRGHRRQRGAPGDPAAPGVHQRDRRTADRTRRRRRGGDADPRGVGAPLQRRGPGVPGGDERPGGPRPRHGGDVRAAVPAPGRRHPGRGGRPAGDPGATPRADRSDLAVGPLPLRGGRGAGRRRPLRGGPGAVVGAAAGRRRPWQGPLGGPHGDRGAGRVPRRRRRVRATSRTWRGRSTGGSRRTCWTPRSS